LRGTTKPTGQQNAYDIKTNVDLFLEPLGHLLFEKKPSLRV